MKKAVIIGASSGIGKELALLLSENNYEIGITARRQHLLEEIKDQCNNPVFIEVMDVSKQKEAIEILNKLIKEMGGLDLIIICSGIGHLNPALEWEKEHETIKTNVLGFTAIADAAFNYFKTKGYGHIVGISSIAALKGNADAPAYNASKAYVSNYLKGLMYKCNKLKLSVTVTDIKPGFVDTDMAKGEGLFWVTKPHKAAKQIYSAIKNKKKRAYISKRWSLIAFLLKTIPDYLYCKL